MSLNLTGSAETRENSSKSGDSVEFVGFRSSYKISWEWGDSVETTGNPPNLVDVVETRELPWVLAIITGIYRIFLQRCKSTTHLRSLSLNW